MVDWRITAGILAAASALLVCATIPEASARDGELPSARERCEAMTTRDFSTVPDAPTAVMEAQEVAAADDVPAHCQVQGYIAPQIGFELKLPASQWNQKFVEVHCGGSGGSIRSTLCIAWCNHALHRGSACIVTDQGHYMSRGDVMQKSGLWAFNNLQAEIDSGFRAGHVAALAGKAMAQAFYGESPRRSYFIGCSYGGRQALVHAQRFPWDFDGIVAMESTLNFTGQSLAQTWNTVAVLNPDGTRRFSDADIELLHAAVLKKCDTDDGLADGIIGDPRQCQFDPGELLCRGTRRSECLAQSQVDAARKVYSGPVTSQGERTVIGHTMPGAERGSFAFRGDLGRANSLFANMVFLPDPPPGWNAHSFDFDSGHKRLGMMEMIYASDNPDLRRFKANGGKLIVVHGWHDSGAPLPLGSVDYYETVEKVMGGRAATQDFARLFMVPGRGHCGGGPGASAIDMFTHIEEWVERGIAPDMMVGYHIEGEDLGEQVSAPQDPRRIKFTRPHYPYPLQARYKGTGDPNDFRNFVPKEPDAQ